MGIFEATGVFTESFHWDITPKYSYVDKVCGGI